MRTSTLLNLDAAINLALGILLIAFPAPLITWLGIPGAASPFYPSILGAVLFGIGLALLLERYRPRPGMVGLGLAGAVAINLCSGLVLAGWLLLGRLSLPVRGNLLLGTLAVVLIGLSALELRAQLRPTYTRDAT